MNAGFKYQLLTMLLERYPADTRQKVMSQFSRVNPNFEFYTWIPLGRAQQIADEANRRGFMVWGNTDSTSALLYGARVVSGDDDILDAVMWLRSITVPGNEGMILETASGTQPRIIKFDSALK